MTAAAILSAAGCGTPSSEADTSSTEESLSTEAEASTNETLLTFTADGIEIPKEEADQYDGDVIRTTTGHLGKISSLHFFDDFPYRSALYIKDGSLDEENSVSAAITGGDYDSTSLSGAEIQAKSADFSGVIINDSDYAIKDTEIIMETDSDGSKTNDFSGLGAAVMNTNNGLLEIEDSTITTTGVAKLALITDNGANTIVKGSTLSAAGGTLYDGYYSNADQLMMVAPPWVLGMDDAVANARTTNLMGDYSTQTFVDCSVYAGGWGALSTDSDADYSTNQHLIAVNSDIVVEDSGYGAYTVTEGVEDYYGVSMDVDTYCIIMTGGEATFQSYTGGQQIDVTQYGKDSEWDEAYTFEDADYTNGVGGIPAEGSGTVIATVESSQVSEGEVVASNLKSDNFGFMCHSNYTNAWNVVKIEDDTTVSTEDAVFLVKKSNADLYVEDATVKSGSNVILQVIDNDDDYVGPDMGLTWGIDDPALGRCIATTNIEALMEGSPCHFPTFNEKLAEPAGWSYEWSEDDMGVTASCLNTTGDSGWSVNFTADNTVLEGNLWNSSGYVTENGGSTMVVTLGQNSSLTGLISSGAFKHTIQENDSLYVKNDGIHAGGYYEALVGNAYAEANGGNADWSNAELLGHVKNTQYYNGYNPVDVTLTDNAVWVVTGTCQLSSLNIGSDAQILADNGTLSMTVDGVKTSIVPGNQYQGDIVLTIE